MTETWCKIRIFGHIHDALSKYSVSSYGRVRNDETFQILKPTLNRSGALRVMLSHGSLREQYQVDHLVIQEFLPIGPHIKIKRVIHKDGDRANCRLDNLELGSYRVI